MNRKEHCAGTINAVLLLLFLAGAVTVLFCWELPGMIWGALRDAALWVMMSILLADVLVCLSPLALALQPPLVFLLGSAACCESQAILQGTTAGKPASHLMLLLLLVPSCFMLGGRGLFNGLLLIRAIRSDPAVLGRSIKYTCVPVLFGTAVIYLLCRFLRYQ